MLLKLAGLDYKTDTSGFRKAPKGKLPYIDDAGTRVADSTFIRFHLEKVRRIDFDKGLNDEHRGVAWAIEKLLEDHLYWLVVRDRWINEDNFNKGPVRFFDAAPALIRPLIIRMVRRRVRANLQGQGLGRHTDAESALLAGRDARALAGALGDKPFLMGETPCGADATLFAFVTAALCPLFQSSARDAIGSYSNLVAYRDRLLGVYYPGLPVGA